MGDLSQFGQRHARVEGSVLIGIVGQVAVDEETPVERNCGSDSSHHLYDRRRAIRGERIVELRLLGELVCIGDVLDEEASGDVRRRLETIELDIFAAKVRANANDVALVRCDDDQRIALEEIGDGENSPPRVRRTSMDQAR